MDPNLNTTCATPVTDMSNILNQHTTLYKPIPIVGSSRSVGTVNEDVSSVSRPMHSTEIPETQSIADIVALDHNYTFPPVLVEVPLLKPIMNPSDSVVDDSKPVKCDKPEKPVKSPKITKKEKAKPPPPPPVEVKPYWSGSTNYIFQIKPEVPSKTSAAADQSSIFMPYFKSSVFPTSPMMSKLEHLLKSPSRSPSSRRSPSSFLSPSLNYHRCKNLAGPGPSAPVQEKEPEVEEDIDIDVESVDPDPELPYDGNRAKNLMNECEKNVIFLRQGEVAEDWEEQIVKTGWTYSQMDIFHKVLQSLHQERLSRLVNENRFGEPVLRRLSIDKTAQRIRKILACYKWDSRLTQWLHGVLVDNLSYDYLSAYLDVLQTLRVKFPELVDKMIILTTGLLNEPLPIDPSMLADPENADLTPEGAQNFNVLKETMKRSLNSEAIGLVLKRKWDPFSSTVQHSKTKKLPSSPIFVIIATNPTKSHSITSKRKKHFVSLLAGRGKVVTVTLNIASQVHMRLHYYMGRLYKIASERIKDLKRQFPERPIFTVGWASGALLACKLSTMDAVAGVISLGFRLHGMFNKGSLAINVLQINCPSLFIIGGLTNYTSVLEMESLRQDMACVASLLVVGCANDELCISNSYRKKLFVTQTYIDRCVVEEIVKFVSSCPVPVPSPEEKAISMAITAAKSKKKVSKLQNPPSAMNTGPSTSAELRAEASRYHEMERSNEGYGSMSSGPERADITNFDFDGPIMIPSNTSSNKRKAYYRPAPSVTSPAEKTSPACITASQLVQQNPGVKRFSKPSGPNIPKGKGQGIVSTQLVSTSLMKNENSLQTQLQSPLVSPTANYVETENVSPSLVFNLVSTNPAQVLRMKRDQETAVAPEAPAAPTRFLFAMEESPPPSPSIVVDQGLKPYLPQPLVLPIQNNQIIKSENEHSGFKQQESTAEIAPAQQRSPPLPTPPPKILPGSSTSTPIITSPTILPGGATATPFIRRTLPAQPPHQKFSSHLFRLLTPPHDSASRRASFPEIPMPTRVTEDLTANAFSSSTQLIASELSLLSKEIPESTSAVQRKDNKATVPKEINTTVAALPKEVVATVNIPAMKLSEGDASNTYTMDKQLSISRYVSSSAQLLAKEETPSTSSSVSLVKPAEETEKSALVIDCGTSEGKALEINSQKTPQSQISPTGDKEEIVIKVSAGVSVDNESVDKEELVVEKEKSEEPALGWGHGGAASSSKLDTVTVANLIPAKDSLEKNLDVENPAKPSKVEKEMDDIGKDNKTILSPKPPEKPKASFEKIVESVAFGLDLQEESEVDSKLFPAKIEKPSLKKKDKNENSAAKRSKKLFKDVLDSPSVTKKKKGNPSTSTFESAANLKSVGKKSGNRKEKPEPIILESNVLDIVDAVVDRISSESKNKAKSSSSESPKTTQSKATKRAQRKAADCDKSEQGSSGNSKSELGNRDDSKAEQGNRDDSKSEQGNSGNSKSEQGNSGNSKSEQGNSGNSKSKKRVLKGAKRLMQDSPSKEEEIPKKLTRSSAPTLDEPEKAKEVTPSTTVLPKIVAEATPKSAEKIDSGRKKVSPVLPKAIDPVPETPISRLRNRSGNPSAATPSTNPHILRKKSRLTYRENSDSESSSEMMDEIEPKQSKKNIRLQKKKSSSSESFESGESLDEGDGKEVAPRVTRSMRRQSGPADPVANESLPSTSAKEDEMETAKESEVATDSEAIKPDAANEEKNKESRGRNSSGSICSGDDEDVECKKRPKPIHPVTPASLSVTRTRKISIPNYFAYGM